MYAHDKSASLQPTLLRINSADWVVLKYLFQTKFPLLVSPDGEQ